MQSEKVKEIKKALEYASRCKWENAPLSKELVITVLDVSGYILTYINELESENDWLVGKVKEKNNESADCLLKIQKLKNQIAELEKENATKTDTITDLLKKQEFYETKKLNQFAERLKEKCRELENKYSHLCKSKKECLMETCRYEGVLAVKREIDETLKEFLK